MGERSRGGRRWFEFFFNCQCYCYFIAIVLVLVLVDSCFPSHPPSPFLDLLLPFSPSTDLTRITLTTLLETVIKEKEKEREDGGGGGRGKVGFDDQKKGKGGGKGGVVREILFCTFEKYSSVKEVMEGFLTILEDNSEKVNCCFSSFFRCCCH